MNIKQATELSIEMLDRVGISDAATRFKQFAFELSGGMRQRAMIAMMLAGHPKLLIADEPTTALDVTVQAQILELLGSLQEARGMSIILITHDLGVVAGQAHRVAVMYAGRIVEEAETRTLFAAPSHPYTRGLLSSIPRLDRDEEQLVPIPGTPPDLLHLDQGCPFRPRCGFAVGACSESEPTLREVGHGHCIACHVDLPEQVQLGAS